MTNPGRTRPTHPVRARFITAAKIVVSVGLVAFLLLKSGLAGIGAALRATDVGWLAAGLVLGLLAAVLQANQWRGLLTAFGLRRTLLRCLRLDTAARLFDAALPTSIGGDVIRVQLVGNSRSETAVAAACVGLRRVVSIPGLLFVLGVSALASWHLDYAGRVRGVAVLVLVTGALLVVGLIVVQRLDALRRVTLPRRLDKIRRSIALARTEAADHTHPFRRSTVRGLVFWVVVVLSQACYIRAVGIHAPFEYAAAVVCCVNAISMLPISVGGYGVREGAFSILLATGGLGTAAQGTAVGLCLSAQTLLFGLIGAVVYLTLRRSRPHPEPIPATPPEPSGRPTGMTPALTLDPS